MCYKSTYFKQAKPATVQPQKTGTMAQNDSGTLYFLLKIKVFLAHLLRKGLTLISPDLTAALPSGPLIVLSPHPDDETLGAGALIARYRANGHKVKIILATEGAGASVKGLGEPDKIAALRHKEACTATRLLGVADGDVVFLSLPDGDLMKHQAQIQKHILKAIRETAPALIVSPCPEKCHDDHQAIAYSLRTLAREGHVTCPIFEYPIWFFPQKVLPCLFGFIKNKRQRKIATKPYLKTKHRALVAYKSQFYGQPTERMRLLFKFIVKKPALGDYELFFTFDKDAPEHRC